MRPIDADALDFTIPENPHFMTATLVQVVKNAIDKAPTIDAVPVVRCRDCINWAGDPKTKPEYAGCWRYGAAHGIIVHENGFCDKGMRREDHERNVDEASHEV